MTSYKRKIQVKGCLNGTSSEITALVILMTYFVYFIEGNRLFFFLLKWGDHVSNWVSILSDSSQ